MKWLFWFSKKNLLDRKSASIKFDSFFKKPNSTQPKGKSSSKSEIPQWSLSVLSNPQKYQCDSMGLHEFFHHSAIVSCITFHIWKSVDCYFSNKVYRDILRNSYVLRKTLKCICTLYMKKWNLQIFIYEKLCMKL